MDYSFSRGKYPKETKAIFNHLSASPASLRNKYPMPNKENKSPYQKK